MNDISDNPYIIFTQSAADFTLNSYIFNECVMPKEVTIERFSFLIREMITYIGFDINLLGFKYLAKLLQYYLVNKDYSYECAIEKVADNYGVRPGSVTCNIANVIELNANFVSTASHFLSMPIEAEECRNVSNAILILGAIFQKFYNCVVIGDEETEEDKIKVINIHRMFFNGK